MNFKLLIRLCFLGGTLATKVNTGGNEDFSEVLKTCLSKLMKEVCPDCVTVHLTIPTKPSWHADALAGHFFEATPMYAITMYTMDRPGYEDPLADQVGLYLVNSEADLKMASKHLRVAKHGKDCVVLVNFYFGRNLDRFLENTISSTWNVGNARRVIFVALIEDEVQVFGSPIRKFGSFNAKSFKKLSVCDTKSLLEVPQEVPKSSESQKSVLTVFVEPNVRPYVERQTDNPGGYTGRLIDVLSEHLNFTPEYNWSLQTSQFPELVKMDALHMVVDLLSIPNAQSGSSARLPTTDTVWVIAAPADRLHEKNILLKPFGFGVLLHVTLLAIYTSVMIYLSQDLDKSRIVIRLFGMFLGIGVGWFPRKPLFRFLIILWCFTSYVLVQAYLAALTSDLSSPLKYKPIRDTRELMESGIPIICSTNIKKMYCNLKSESSVHICKNCMVPDAEWHRNLMHNITVLKKTYGPYAFNSDRQIFKQYSDSGSFYVMKERVGVWPGMIYSNAGEPFMKTVANISQKLHESGILKHWLTGRFMNNASDQKSEPYVLNMTHLKDVFIILYVGWSCSIIAFIIEILISWRGN